MAVTKYFNESLRKGLTVLATVAASETPIGVTEVADRSGLDYSTTYRFLATLSELGYLERDPVTKQFSASVGTLRLGYSYLRNNALHKAAIPLMRELLSATGETVNLSVRHDTDMVLLTSCESQHILGSRHSPSGRYPLHCTASGKVMLAAMRDDEIAGLLDRLPMQRLTIHTIRTRESLMREVQKVRRKGWALNDEEHVLGLVAIAAPIRDQATETIGALDISAPTARVTAADAIEVLVPSLMEAAARVSMNLGWRSGREAFDRVNAHTR